MSAHALLPLLVFEHDFIRIRFGIFEFFCFCFMNNKLFLILSNFTRYLFSVITFFLRWETYRSSRPEVFCDKGVLGNFTKFTGKHQCQGLFFNKVAGRRPATLLKIRFWHRFVFFREFCEISKITFLTEHLYWLLLHICNECWILIK